MAEPKEKSSDKSGEREPTSSTGPTSPASDERQASASPADETPAAPADPIAEAKAETARFKDQWVRTAADFDNFRKRSRREVEDAKKSGREDLLKDLLPVFDNLERAVQSAQRATDVKAVSDGLAMVIRQFTDTIGRSGIAKVPTTGKLFDPSVHEAIQQVETDEHPPGTIVAEVQPGYTQGERLVRAAMVVVAKPKTKADGNGDGGEGDAKGEGAESGG